MKQKLFGKNYTLENLNELESDISSLMSIRESLLRLNSGNMRISAYVEASIEIISETESIDQSIFEPFGAILTKTVMTTPRVELSNKPNFISQVEASKYLGVTPSQVSTLVKHGELPIIPGSKMIDKDDFLYSLSFFKDGKYIEKPAIVKFISERFNMTTSTVYAWMKSHSIRTVRVLSKDVLNQEDALKVLRFYHTVAAANMKDEDLIAYLPIIQMEYGSLRFLEQ